MNQYGRWLLIGGGAAVVAGAAIALIAAQQAKYSANVDVLTGSMLGYNYGASAATTAANGWMWFGVILAILGAIALIAGIAVSAVTSERSPTSSE